MPTVIALLSAYNEEDILGQALDHLIAQGVDVYVLDDGSTDRTAEIAEARLGRGVIAVERRPVGSQTSSMSWTAVLRRKEELAASLDADWFIHHDADEFRESPWPHLTLAQALDAVGRLGYNAVDALVLNFPPTNDGFHAGRPVSDAFSHYEAAPPFDAVQIKCWRRQPALVDLRSSGGHDVRFPDRRVCPIRFLLRHYPIRGQAHGERKVFGERRARFSAEERALGWHRQYDAWRKGDSFLRDPGTLVRYDADSVRASLAAEANVDGTIAALEQALAGARADQAAQARRTADLQLQLSKLQVEVSHLHAQAGEAAYLRDALAAMHASASWRLTAPLRAIYGGLTGAKAAEPRPSSPESPSARVPVTTGLEPISRRWGLERGQPVDRYYIERFLAENRGDIRGRVLEVKDAGYTRAYGGDAVRAVAVLDIDPANPLATVVGDLAGPDLDAGDPFDCVILTQTLHIIYDIRAALTQTKRLLAEGGVLLCTIPAVSRVNDEHGGLESGDYWRLTQAAVRRLFGEVFRPSDVSIATFGNVRACSAFLYGLASEDLSPAELAFVDPWFPLIHCVRVEKHG